MNPVAEKTPGFPGFYRTGICRLNWAHLASHTTNAGRAAAAASATPCPFGGPSIFKRFFEIVIIFKSVFVLYSTMVGTTVLLTEFYGTVQTVVDPTRTALFIYLVSIDTFQPSLPFFFKARKTDSRGKKTEKNLDSSGG